MDKELKWIRAQLRHQEERTTRLYRVINRDTELKKILEEVMEELDQ